VNLPRSFPYWILIAALTAGSLGRPTVARAVPPLPTMCDGLETIEVFNKPAIFRNKTDAIADFDNWRIRGSFNTPADFAFDDETDSVRLVLEQDEGVVYDVALPPGSLTELMGKTVRWLFRLLPNQPDVPGAEGWRFARIRKLPSKVGPSNKISFRFGGLGVSMPFVLDMDPGDFTQVRETLRMGNKCVTSVLSCINQKQGKQLRCFSLP
jgi:hypothetical protein